MIGWGKNIKRCGGAIDQVGTWSNVQNRLKTNSKKGTIQFKQISLREIDPNLDWTTELFKLIQNQERFVELSHYNLYT